MRAITVDQLQPEQCYDDHIFLTPKELLIIAAGTSPPGYLQNILPRWGFVELYSNGQKITPSENLAQGHVRPKGESLIEEDLQVFPQMQQVRALFASQIENFYHRYQQNQVLLAEELLSMTQNLGNAVRGLPRLALRLTLFPQERSSTAHYSLNSTLLSLALAVQRKVPKHRAIIEGCATILYALATTERVDNEQRPWESKHFRDAVNYFKNQNLPAEILELVLRHQRGGGDEQILPFSCWYCRQLEKMESVDSPHTIILRMLKREGSAFDASLQKELLGLLSLFPLGSYVKLRDDIIGMTFDVDPADPRHPSVLVLRDPHKLFAGAPTLLNTSRDFPILSALNHEQTALIPPPYKI